VLLHLAATSPVLFLGSDTSESIATSRLRPGCEFGVGDLAGTVGISDLRSGGAWLGARFAIIKCYYSGNHDRIPMTMLPILLLIQSNASENIRAMVIALRHYVGSFCVIEMGRIAGVHPGHFAAVPLRGAPFLFWTNLRQG